MIIDGPDVESVVMQGHPVIKELHAIEVRNFDISTKLYEPIEPQTVVFYRFGTDVFLVSEIKHIFIYECIEC